MLEIINIPHGEPLLIVHIKTYFAALFGYTKIHQSNSWTTRLVWLECMPSGGLQRVEIDIMGERAGVGLLTSRQISYKHYHREAEFSRKRPMGIKPQ